MSDFATQLGQEIAAKAMAERQPGLPMELPEQEPAPGSSGVERDAPTGSDAKNLQVQHILSTIKGGKGFWKDTFTRIKKDIRFVRGDDFYADQDPEDDRYRANLIQRHIKQRTAALYAKNPTPVYKRAPRRDFQVWDGKMESLMLAQQTLMQFQQANPQMPLAPENMEFLPPNVQQAIELMSDVERGKSERQMLDAIGDTLVKLVGYYFREQEPTFKNQMRGGVRRTKTCGISYVMLDYKRVPDPTVDIGVGLQDSKEQLNEIDRLRSDKEDAEFTDNDKEAEQLALAEDALLDKDAIILREGPEFIFPKATQIILDPKIKRIQGFVGAEWLAYEAPMTVDQIQAEFKKDLSSVANRSFGMDGTPVDLTNYATVEQDPNKTKFVMVYKFFHRPTGLQYTVAEGWNDYLEPPRAPRVRFESFFPVLPLIFDDAEEDDDEEETTRKKQVYPLSDVSLLRSQQLEYNRRREAERQHRIASRPLYACAPDAFEEEEEFSILEHADHDVIKLNAMSGEGRKLENIVQAWPKQNVNPEIYEVDSIFADIQRTVGSQESEFGGVSGGTATESSIAESKVQVSTAADVDALDDFLSLLVRETGKLLLREMPEDRVKKIVGPGAVWPTLTREQIAEEVFLEVEAGSSGRPNQAQEIANLERLMPFISQTPGIAPSWIARRLIRAVDDSVDLTEAYLEGMPSITSMNDQSQMGTGDPATDPNQQGAEGADNAPAPADGTEGAPDGMLRQVSPAA